MAPVAAELQILVRSLSPARRRELWGVALLMPVTALFEAAMLAAIVPFISLLLGSTAAAPGLPAMASVLDRMQLLLSTSPLTSATILFALMVTATASLRLSLSWMSQRFAFAVGHELAVETQRRVLYQPYSFHLRSHSSTALSTLEKVDHLVFNFVLQAIQAIVALVVAAVMIGLLVLIDPLTAALSLLLVGGLFALATWAARKGVARYAAVVDAGYGQRIRIVQEGIGSIRDLILDHSQAAHIDRLKSIDRRFMHSRARMAFLVAAPRHLVEAAGLLIIAGISLAIAGRSGGIETALPMMGALALGAHRLLPMMSQFYGAWAGLSSSRPIVANVAAILNLPLAEAEERYEPMPFSSAIKFDKVSFLYPDRLHQALHDVSLAVRKGSRVAITGKSGSGKSTLADLLMGLISPSSGRVMVDGVTLEASSLPSWRRAIAHVPQSIFLADASIAANIALAFHETTPDMDRVRTAARMAQLDEFVRSLPQGYDTMVGENAVRLSGGQRQRLGLARAIYKQASVLVLDEATSALDPPTEKAVFAALDELQASGCTILIIGHRGWGLAGCDEIFVLEDGQLARSNEGRELVRNRISSACH